MKISLQINSGAKSKNTQNKNNAVSVPVPPNRRRRLIFWSIYILLLTVVIIYGTSASTYLASKSYENKKSGFSIRPPKNWLTKEKVHDSVVEFSDPKHEDTSKINVSVDNTTASLSDYVKFIKEELGKALPGYGILKEYDTVIQNQTVHIIEGEVLIKNVWKKDRVLIEVKNKHAFIVAATTNLGDWKSVEHTLNTSLKTFEVL